MKIEKVEKLVADFHNKKEHFIHTSILKQTLNHEFIFFKKKVHRAIKFNQKGYLK